MVEPQLPDGALAQPMIKSTPATLVVCHLLALLLMGRPAVAGDAVTVLELFTSQGCSSCPPADRLLGEFAKRPSVLALTYPVDYWDYLGWKDTLASPANSDRQRAYAEGRGDRSIYTPQLVVNGEAHVVGSNKQAIEQAIKAAPTLPVSVALEKSGDHVDATVDGTLPSGTSMATVYFVFIDDRETVPIPRGENTGRTITYTNVVRSVRAVGMWDGGHALYRLPMSELTKAKADRCAALVQIEHDGRPGTILGAGVM